MLSDLLLSHGHEKAALHQDNEQKYPYCHGPVCPSTPFALEPFEPWRKGLQQPHSVVPLPCNQYWGRPGPKWKASILHAQHMGTCTQIW